MSNVYPMITGRSSVGVCVALAASVMVAQPTGHAAQSAPGARVEQADGTPRYTNRLINEKSPYLQLHAHDPVDWFPWGAEAFETARREGKPIFLSVGYSTCHWCHVMQAESFSNVGIAEIMNRSFVSIKVDREERPDLDRVYQSYVISVLGVGGWPLSVFLTPDLEPFVGDTYIEREDRNGRQGFRALLQVLTTQWAADRDKLLALANDGTRSIQAQSGRRPPAEEILNANVLDQAYASIKATYDTVEGGFRRAPKFARPVTLNFLLRDYSRTGNKEALGMVLQTLRAMARGGIHDQLGGGFHRYATDRAWRVPHFEKMLYDQAQIATAYTEAYQITKDAAFAAVARDVLDYVLRDMRSPDGGFFSAEDADSATQAAEQGAARHAEGAFYVWTAEEIRTLLGREAGEVCAFFYGAEAAGNVPPAQDAEGDLAGKNVLSVRHTVAETAAKFRKSERDTRQLLARARDTLLAARTTRPRPSRDDKVLVAWNGLMVSALARAAQVFDDRRYLDAARASAAFVEARLYDRDTNLLTRRYRQGDAAIDGVLEDYAFLIGGLLDLYEASFEAKWLSWAARLQEQQDRLFWDAEGGGYFSTRAEASNVLVRMKDDYDGDQPSANSVAAMNLLRLWQIADRQDWRDRADQTFKALGTRLTRSGDAVPQMAVAFAFALSKPRQIIIAGEPGASDTRAMLRLVHNRFMPNRILLLADGGPGQQQIGEWLPFFENITRRDGRATIYVCENYACRLPTPDLKVAARQLDGR